MKPANLANALQKALSRRKQKAPTFTHPPLGKATPAWYLRIDLIIDRVEACGWRWFDRRAIQVMFDVSSATAARILVKFNAPKIGTARTLSREELLHILRAIQENPRWQTIQENNEARWSKIAALHNPARVIRYTPPSGAGVTKQYRIADLPANVDLTSEGCTIRCRTHEELLQSLTELAVLVTQNIDAVKEVFGE